MTFTRFLILGLATGSLYALSALSIVIVSRAAGILNFASAGVGAVAAYLTYTLRDEHGVPQSVALLLGIGLGAVLGLATQLIVMELLRKTAPLTKLIATLGVLTILQGSIVLIWGDAGRGQPDTMLPSHLVEPFDGVIVSADRLYLIGLSLAAAVVLKLLYTRTPFGLATAAVAENREVAAMAGLSANRIEMANFAIAGALSASAAILLAPVVGLAAAALIGLIIPALAAALIGRFSSFGVTVAAALIIGVIQAEIPQLQFVQDRPNGSLAGLPQAVPVLLIAIVTGVRGRGRLQRGVVTDRLPRPGTGRLNVPVLVGAVALGLLITSTASATWVTAITVTLAIGILVLSVVLVTGYAGQLSLAQFALAGFGLWVAARLYDTQDWPFPLALLAGVLVSVPMGLAVALPALRARGVDLAVATLGLALAIQSLILGNVSITGGFEGTNVAGITLFGWDVNAVDHANRYASMVLVALVIATLVVANVRRGRSGRRLLAVRSNERAAASLGVGVYGAKLYAFGVSAALAGLSGVMLGFKDPAARFDQFDIFGSITAVQYAVIGGLGFAGGAVIGAALAVGGLAAAIGHELASSPKVSQWVFVAGGVFVVTLLRMAPDGMLAAVTGRLPSWGMGKPRITETSTPRRERELESLEVEGIGVSFGGVVALDALSCTIRPGEVLGLIGPNGAGKTTFLDVMTGFTKPTTGSVRFGGKDLARWSPERRARGGLARSFQSVELFEELTVRENLLVATDTQQRRHWFTDLLWPGRQPHSTAMDEVVVTLGLEDVLEHLPSQLSQAQARLVGIARALCTEPVLLFLDEPAAGLDAHERDDLGDTIRSLADDLKIGVVLVEHDVPLVLKVCDRVIALDFGKLLCEGTPTEVRNDPSVRASYLGAEADAL